MEIAVDSSAIMAVLLGEPDAAHFDAAMRKGRVLMSVGTRIELEVAVLRKFGSQGTTLLHELLDTYELEFVAVEVGDLTVAFRGIHAFLKGRGTEPSALNYGDIFSYTLSKQRNIPLLYKGNDFAATDVQSAVP